MPAPSADCGSTAHSDPALIDRHRHGDPDAFDEIYEEFSGMVFNLALRLSGDVEDAADLSQETFLKVHRYLAGFRGRSSSISLSPS